MRWEVLERAVVGGEWVVAASEKAWKMKNLEMIKG